MRAPTDTLFGTGFERVNTNQMAKLVGCAPSTLREWRAGKFPPALRTFARICKFRGLRPDQVADLVKQFE